ncbi:P-loop containing nucleoside triphosphate hydrolase protein [Halenospora varia]|nr:P-loop containing nucleoside triphosphate hydrolase protein [Halenospora varia]
MSNTGSFAIPGAWQSWWENPVGEDEAAIAEVEGDSVTATAESMTRTTIFELQAGDATVPKEDIAGLSASGYWDIDSNPFEHPDGGSSEPSRISEPETSSPTAPISSADGRESGGQSKNNEWIEGQRPIVIAVFGQTGTGKTSFIKTVTGQDLEVGHNLTSCTENVLPIPCRIGNENVVLVDTPGFSDTNLSDTEILKRIATWMQDEYYEGSLLSGIIYLHRIIDPRMEGPSLKNLRMMKKLCGANSLKNVVLATTMWEKVTDEEGLRREGDLKTLFWKDMIDGGAKVRRIRTESGKDARSIVKALLKKTPVTTQLQEELHSGKTLVQTEAGMEIKEEMAKLEQKLRAEQKIEIEELKRAERARECQFSSIRAIRES